MFFSFFSLLRAAFFFFKETQAKPFAWLIFLLLAPLGCAAQNDGEFIRQQLKTEAQKPFATKAQAPPSSLSALQQEFFPFPDFQTVNARIEADLPTRCFSTTQNNEGTALSTACLSFLKTADATTLGYAWALMKNNGAVPKKTAVLLRQKTQQCTHSTLDCLILHGLQFSDVLNFSSTKNKFSAQNQRLHCQNFGALSLSHRLGPFLDWKQARLTQIHPHLLIHPAPCHRNFEDTASAPLSTTKSKNLAYFRYHFSAPSSLFWLIAPAETLVFQRGKKIFPQARLSNYWAYRVEKMALSSDFDLVLQEPITQKTDSSAHNFFLLNAHFQAVVPFLSTSLRTLPTLAELKLQDKRHKPQILKAQLAPQTLFTFLAEDALSKLNFGPFETKDRLDFWSHPPKTNSKALIQAALYTSLKEQAELWPFSIAQKWRQYLQNSRQSDSSPSQLQNAVPKPNTLKNALCIYPCAADWKESFVHKIANRGSDVEKAAALFQFINSKITEAPSPIEPRAIFLAGKGKRIVLIKALLRTANIAFESYSLNLTKRDLSSYSPIENVDSSHYRNTSYIHVPKENLHLKIEVLRFPTRVWQGEFSNTWLSLNPKAPFFGLPPMRLKERFEQQYPSKLRPDFANDALRAAFILKPLNEYELQGLFKIYIPAIDASAFRQMHQHTSLSALQALFTQALSAQLNGMAIDDFSISNLLNRGKPLLIKMKFRTALPRPLESKELGALFSNGLAAGLRLQAPWSSYLKSPTHKNGRTGITTEGHSLFFSPAAELHISLILPDGPFSLSHVPSSFSQNASQFKVSQKVEVTDRGLQVDRNERLKIFSAQIEPTAESSFLQKKILQKMQFEIAISRGESPP